MIYLRWRWNDPWTADLIDQSDYTDDGDATIGFDQWYKLDIPHFSQYDSLDAVKNAAMEAANKFLFKKAIIL